MALTSRNGGYGIERHLYRESPPTNRGDGSDAPSSNDILLGRRRIIWAGAATYWANAPSVGLRGLPFQQPNRLAEVSGGSASVELYTGPGAWNGCLI